MAGEWQTKSLADLAELHQEQVNPAEWPERQFQHFSIPAFDCGQVPAREPGSSIGSQKFSVPPTAILVSKLNPRIPRVWEPDVRDCGPAVTSTEFLVLVPRDGTDRRFLKYACLSPAVRMELEARATGTSGSHQRVRADDALTIELDVPASVSEQRAIAHILGTLDDKIELNRRMSETLEAMARALFKAWFVDFDPVRAKAEGRDPGLPQPLADLFPDSFEDSELGEVPKGWRVGRFGDVVEQLRDQENPRSSPEALFHHFSLPAFDEGQSPKAEYGESIKSQKSRVPTGVVLLSKLNPEIERVWLVDVRPPERAVCSTEFLVLRARPPFTRSFVYCLARSPLFRQQVEGLATGTSKSHQRAQVEAVFNLAVVVPPSVIVAAFDRSADSLLARTLECRRECRTLAALRDTLLPKLISAELRVKDAERFLETASP
jgi:type I restriction enzyme S subunit